MSKVCSIYAGKSPLVVLIGFIHTLYLLRYVIVKVVRKDHLDQLPVPSRIKSYLNTPFYYSEQVKAIARCLYCRMWHVVMSYLPSGDRKWGLWAISGGCRRNNWGDFRGGWDTLGGISLNLCPVLTCVSKAVIPIVIKSWMLCIVIKYWPMVLWSHIIIL